MYVRVVFAGQGFVGTRVCAGVCKKIERERECWCVCVLVSESALVQMR